VALTPYPAKCAQGDSTLGVELLLHGPARGRSRKLGGPRLRGSRRPDPPADSGAACLRGAAGGRYRRGAPGARSDLAARRLAAPQGASRRRGRTRDHARGGHSQALRDQGGLEEARGVAPTARGSAGAWFAQPLDALETEVARGRRARRADQRGERPGHEVCQPMVDKVQDHSEMRGAMAGAGAATAAPASPAPSARPRRRPRSRRRPAGRAASGPPPGRTRSAGRARGARSRTSRAGRL
jgi:hypothetical protein